MDKITVDTRGLSCPQPVLLTKNALKTSRNGQIEIFIDNRTALENVSWYLKNAGKDYTSRKSGEDYIIEVNPG